MNNLYHLTAIPATGINAVAHGSFSAPKQQELILSTGTSLELYRLLPKQGRLVPIFRADAFAKIRALQPFRLPATRRDYLVVTSDTGAISVLSPDVAAATFRTVHCEPFGRTGCRRVVPGEFLACEPRGRACMVAAVERSKFAYVLNRDAQDQMTISSPLEAHRSNCSVFALQAVDVGFENPVFVALERAYDENAKKHLVYYELELGLNHVVRKLAVPVRPSSYVVVPVPGHTDGPGGVLICSAGYVTYHLMADDEELVLGSNPATNGAPDRSTPPARLEALLPYRNGTSQGETMIVCATAYHDRKGNAFFFMLCTEFGDLIKAELAWTPEEGATQLRLVYFDSLPAPAVTMAIFRSGFLFVALEGSDGLLLRFRAVDVPDDDPAGGLSVNEPLPTRDTSAMDVDTVSGKDALISSHTHALANGSIASGRASVLIPSDTTQRLSFIRKPKLTYLSLVSTLESLAPIISVCNAVDVDGEATFLLSTGRGRGSCVRGLRRGMGVIEMSAPHALASRIYNVFTFKHRIDAAFHRYIVVSFRDRTKVLLVGDGRVEETFASGFELSVSTLCAGQMGEDSLLQVHAQSVRFIPHAKAEQASEWKPPVPSRIVGASCNNGQLVVALSSGVVVYFEVNTQKVGLLEMETITEALVPSGGDAFVSLGAGDEGAYPALGIPDVPPGRRRAPFFAIGDGANCKVRIYRVKNDGSTEPLGIHIAPAAVESVALVDFGIVAKHVGGAGSSDKTAVMDDSAPYEALLSLVIGTKHGAVVRLSVDGVTGSLGDKRSMFIGPDRVLLRCATMGGVPTCFVLGSRPHLLFAQGGRIVSSPLGTEGVQYAASFSSEESPDGFVAAHGSKLRLLCVDLLHALQAGAEAATPSAAAALPASTALGCQFQMTRSRASGTVRRVVRIAERSGAEGGGGGGRREGGGSKRPRAQNMFAVVEADHRAVGTDSGGDAGSTVGLGCKRLEVKPGEIGKWFSRLLLVKMGAGDGNDGEDGTMEEEFDGSDVMFNFGTEAVSCLDSVVLKDSAECILSVASTCAFATAESEAEAVSYVVVSSVRNMVISATSPAALKERNGGGMGEGSGNAGKVYGILSVYRIEKGLKLKLVHETRVDEPTYVVTSFRDMIAVGVGTLVRLYAMGKKQLLRKVEYRLAVENAVCAIATTGGDRLFVADRRESVTLFKYVRPSVVGGGAGTMVGGRASMAADGDGVGWLVAIASDEMTRWVTCLHAVDYATVCGGDKFGNLFVLRLPSEVTAGAEEIGGMAGGTAGRGGKSGARCARHRLQVEACMHVGSLVTNVTTGRLNGSGGGSTGGGRSARGGGGIAAGVVDRTGVVDESGGKAEASILYTTMNGAVGLVVALTTESDAEFVRRLEMAMRKDWRSMVGRDHLSFRSCFYAARGMVDGDLCELFVSGSKEKKEEWAKAVGRSVNDVMRKLEELRASAV